MVECFREDWSLRRRFGALGDGCFHRSHLPLVNCGWVLRVGPLTFQCACFICICSSAADGSRWFMSVFSSARRFAEMSFSVSHILGASARLTMDFFTDGFLNKGLP